MEPKMTGDEIVISGIAGRFPNSDNIKELQKKLLNKIDCIDERNDRWENEYPDIPKRIGTLNNLDSLDSVFFGIHGKMEDCMDPMLKILIETTYEAITDAGINPRNLRGTKTAVFTGSMTSESEKSVTGKKFWKNKYSLYGISRAMLPNRLSFLYDLTGPSINIDADSCGGSSALLEGFMAIKDGRVENAIIGASNVLLYPEISKQLLFLELLSPDGKNKSFDNSADGVTRSESTVVLLLQKACNAKRIYAEVKSASVCFGNLTSDKLHFYPDHDFQSHLMRRTLKECGILGKDISFVEATGLALKNIDAEEVTAIDEVYNEGRETPLLIGSVKSNLGYCAATSPLNGVIKVITAMESGYIPPNLHFNEPSNKISALKQNRCQVVTELTPWTGDYAVVNALSLEGPSGNIILKSFKKEKKNEGKPDDNLPRLIICSARTEECVNFLLSELESRPVDAEMIQLLYDVFETEITAHLYRGFTVLPPEGLVENKSREIQFNTGTNREIWYMFSGMGSQWVGMGEALLKIPVFAEAINKCDRVLKPRGIDIVGIITENDPKMFDNIVNSFVGIAAIQIGLVDVLDSVGVKPDFLIGHSVGELGCAYADGCFTAEQMVLAALSRGLASVEAEMPRGSMAAVGLGYEEIKNLCPPDIDVACHNSSSSSTISGPEESMKTFIANLIENKIFAKEVACSNIAYHSRYISPAGEKLKKYLQEIVPNPKPRSDRWISSSVPRNEWKTARARLSSAAYHTNNLLNPVLFAESTKLIPSSAIVIEIAPHGLLQAIVKKSLPKNVLNIPLTRRGHLDGVFFLLEGLGKIYNTGRNIKVSNLYPRISYPVSRGTPSISSLIKWDHSKKWFTSKVDKAKEVKEGEIKFTIDLNNDTWDFLKHAKFESKIVIPLSLYLKLVSDIIRSFQDNTEFSIVYKNVEVHKQQVEISVDNNIELVIMVQKGTGFFEVTSMETLLCSGMVNINDDPNQNSIDVYKEHETIDQYVNESQVYSELQRRGFQYSVPFTTIQKSSIDGNSGYLVWKDNWTTFLDGMIQMYILGNDTRTAQVPIKIKNIFIDMKHQEEITNKSIEIPVTIHRRLGNISAGGVKMIGVVLESILNESGRQNIVAEEILPNSILGAFEHIPLSCNLQKVSNWKAKQLKSLDLNSISWIEDLPTKAVNKIKVEYASINQGDILLAKTNKSLEEPRSNRLDIKSFGQEYSGTNLQENRVMGIVKNSALSNYITPDEDFTWKIPENWSLEDAVTVPLAYANAYLALMIKGQLEVNQSVFVYDGSCSIGQAIINLALNLTSQIFVRLSNDDEKCNMKINFSNIPESHFINSSISFADQILEKTKGKGADLIIYNGDDLSKIESCMMSVKNCGKVVIIGNMNATLHRIVGLQIFRTGIALSAIIPSHISNLDNATKKIISQMILNGISWKLIKPLHRCVYSREMVKDAFIHGASNNASGKVVVKIQPEDGSNKALSIPRFLCKSEASYLIIDGLGDIGLELIDFLVVRGARSIVIASESKNDRAFINHQISLWRSYGVLISVREELDLTHCENGNALLEEVGTFGTVDAIFDLQRLNNSSKRSSNSKYLFTKHLFEESKQMCPNLRQFVVFSTCNHIIESINDIFLREIDLTKIFKQKSKAVTGLLILLGPVSGIAKKTTKYERNVPILTNSIIMKEMDNLIASNANIVSLSLLIQHEFKL
ncbi:fatty acid synthase-like [Leptopilina heterotoma]|uniref:fatty acid synthase-like n=1 Tax=Leptopilina heterotoma TaxID=63436 RepID=UPI001CA91687|nr:fatty acid synthase-like [Leptopilina heterotoma]